MIDVIDPTESGLHVPEVDECSRPFFEALARGKFFLQWLPEQGFQHYPRPACLYAADNQPEWREASGRGVVHTFTVVRQHGLDYFARRVPYVVAIVELDEGVRMMTALEGVAPDDVHIGLPVELYAVRVAPDLAVPFWRPVRSGGSADYDEVIELG